MDAMSTNRFETTAYVLDEVLIRFINYLNYAKVANRNFEDDFKNLKYATGQTINYRLEEVEKIIGRTRMTLRKWWVKNLFPKPILVNNRLAWKSTEIETWINKTLQRG